MNKKSYIKLGLWIIFIMIGIGYLYLFFQQGIYYHDTFLVKIKNENKIEYEGTVGKDSVLITVEGNMKSNEEAQVHYLVGDWLDVTYQVKEEYNQKHGRTEVLTYAGDLLVFRGIYERPDFISKVSPDGEAFIYDSENDSFIKEQSAIKFQLSHFSTIAIAYQENVRMRGNISWLLLGVVLLIFTAIDKKWPLLFFTWEHFMSVRDPEPSDLYLMIQKVSWVVIPILVAVFLFMGLMNVSG